MKELSCNSFSFKTKFPLLGKSVLESEFLKLFENLVPASLEPTEEATLLSFLKANDFKREGSFFGAPVAFNLIALPVT